MRLPLARQRGRETGDVRPSARGADHDRGENSGLSSGNLMTPLKAAGLLNAGQDKGEGQ